MVKTSDVMGAGTDANVFLNLFGINGVTGSQQLKDSTTNTNKFERNNTDIFILKVICMTAFSRFHSLAFDVFSKRTRNERDSACPY